MNKEIKEKFLNYFKLPDELSLEKIDERGINFRETSDGKVKFDFKSYISLYRGRNESSSPARWHVFKTYTFDPETHTWDIELNDVEFHYEKIWLIEEEMVYLNKNGVIQEAIEGRENKEEMIEEILQKVEERYERMPQAYETSEEKWNKMIQDLIEGLKSRLMEEVDAKNRQNN